MPNQGQFVRRTAAVLMAFALILGLLPGFAVAQDLSTQEARSACASRVYPPNPPNEGILFVDHSKNDRGGHLGHALVQYAPGKILAFYPNTTAGHSAVGWMEFKRSEDGVTWDDGVYLRMREAGMGAYSNSIVVDAPDGSGKQRLLIQASHAYNKSHATNVLHWWLESETAETPRGEGETLYNGIVLPQNWPPGIDPQSDDPMPVPYLDSPPEIIPIDLGRQLFVDDFLVEKTDMEQVFHKPVVYEKNPVLTPLRKEGNFVALLAGGIFWNPEKNRFEMYFASNNFHHRSLNLATSQDMIKWKRTDVGGGTGSCIFEPGKWVPGDERAGSRGAVHVVILDLAAKDPAERYKMLMQRSWGGEHTHVLRTSPDLVQWSEGILAGPGHDTSLAFYNPFRKKWVFSIKGQQGSGEGPGELGRFRLYLEKDSFTEGSDWSDKVFWSRADRLDLPEPADGYPDHPEEGGRTQLYNLHAMPYESLMVGLFEIHRGPHNNVCEKGRFPKLTDINVGFSRDGFHWDRPDRSGFINSTRKEGSWHKGYTRGTASVCVVFEDKLIFPFTGFSGTDPFTGNKGFYAGATIGIATLRRDGFASMHAREEYTGTLTTRRVTFTGEYLFVNVDNPVGELKVEVLDEAGKVIPGFSLEDCIPISADSTKAMITWKKNKSLKALAGEPVRFRFSLQNGDLYTFWVSKTEAGHSGGYLAGGGPGYKGHRDMAE